MRDRAGVGGRRVGDADAAVVRACVQDSGPLDHQCELLQAAIKAQVIDEERDVAHAPVVRICVELVDSPHTSSMQPRVTLRAADGSECTRASVRHTGECGRARCRYMPTGSGTRRETELDMDRGLTRK